MKSAVDYGSKPPVIGKRILLTEPWLKVEVGGGAGNQEMEKWLQMFSCIEEKEFLKKRIVG